MDELEAYFNGMTVASTKTIVDYLIDAIFYSIPGAFLPTLLETDILLDAIASRSAGGTRKHGLRTILHAYHATAANSTMKTNVTPVITEWEDMTTDSGMYDTVDSVEGGVIVRLASNPDDPTDPGGIVVDAGSAVTGATGDGYIDSMSSPTGYATWAEARDAEVGSSSDTTSAFYASAIHGSWINATADFQVTRAFFFFDLSGVPAGTITAARFGLWGMGLKTSNVGVQEGTHASTLILDNFDAFTGPSFGNTSWETGEYNNIDFNAAGLTYVQSILDASGTAKLCAREYDHDVLNVEPAADYQCGCYFSEASDLVSPTLTLWIRS